LFHRSLAHWRLPPSSAIVYVALLLGGCSTYNTLPLTQHTTALSVTSLNRLTVDTARLAFPSLQGHRFDVSDGLDITEVATLAVINNPDLRLARDDLGIARAQAFSAHLLPDPQLALTGGVPTPAVTGNVITAYSLGLNYDLIALLTHRVATAAADANAQQADLGLLWQEWQIIARARQLFLKVQLDRQILPLLSKEETLALSRYDAYHHATIQHEMTDDATAAVLIAWQDARKAHDTEQRTATQNTHDLNLLLVLTPDTQLQLVDDPSIRFTASAGAATLTPGGGKNDIQQALADLPQRRPDLLALRAGYQSQEAKLRLAIWNQFPMLTVGASRDSDNSAYKNLGLSLGITLPIFNRNRGNIRIETVTRQRLHDDYQNRIDAAYADVALAQADLRVLEQQQRVLDASIPYAQRAADDAKQAYKVHDMTIGPYTDAMLAALSRRVDSMTLHEALDEQRVALSAVLGMAPQAIPTAQISGADPTPLIHFDRTVAHEPGASPVTAPPPVAGAR